MKLNIKYRVLLFCLSTLLILLPLNTLLVQFLVVNLGFPVWFTLWKELFAGIVMIISIWEIFQNTKSKMKSAKFDQVEINQIFKSNFVLVLVILMTLIGLVNSIGKVGINFILYGFRFELYWVWLWVLLFTLFKIQNAKFKAFFENKLINSLILGFFSTTLFSFITIVFGTENILSLIGYGKQTIQSGSEFLFVQPVGHLIDAGGWNSSFRLSGSFSSPNHYAIYLILLLPLFIVGSFSKFKVQNSKTKIEYTKSLDEKSKDKFKIFSPDIKSTLSSLYQKKIFWNICLILDLILLGLTFARFSYLVIFVFAAVLILLWLQNSKFKIQKWLKKTLLVLIFSIPLLISIVVLNLPISTLQSYFPTWLAKPSSTEWHQQHTSAAFRTLIYETYPDFLLNEKNLKPEQILLISNLEQKNKDLTSVTYRILTGYGMGTTDPASKYLPLDQNPIVKLGFGIDDEKYFPRQIDRPLATTPENWFLGLWVKGGVFYMLLFLCIMLYFAKGIRYLFLSDDTKTLQNGNILTKMLVGLSVLGLIIAGFLLDIFDSQSLALLIGPMYFSYLNLYIE